MSSAKFYWRYYGLQLIGLVRPKWASKRLWNLYFELVCLIEEYVVDGKDISKLREMKSKILANRERKAKNRA